jgi:SAM-dependent methyltransferase
MCGGFSLHPIPGDLDTYYDQSYAPYQMKLLPSVEKQYWELEAAKLEFVQKYIKSGRLIDVGPAAGRFLVLAKKAGFTVAGIEQDATCCEHISRDLGIDVVNSGNPAETLLGMGHADIVVAFHVIEHLPDLRAFLKATAKTVRPGGLWCFQPPNPKSWSFAVYGRHWAHLPTPLHASLIPVNALDEIMVGHGCRQVGLTFRDPVGLVMNKAAWYVPGARLLGKMFGNKNGSCLSRFLARFLGLIMSPFDALPGRGSAYTVVYRRDL